MQRLQTTTKRSGEQTEKHSAVVLRERLSRIVFDNTTEQRHSGRDASAGETFVFVGVGHAYLSTQSNVLRDRHGRIIIVLMEFWVGIVLHAAPDETRLVFRQRRSHLQVYSVCGPRRARAGTRGLFAVRSFVFVALVVGCGETLSFFETVTPPPLNFDSRGPCDVLRSSLLLACAARLRRPWRTGKGEKETPSKGGRIRSSRRN